MCFLSACDTTCKITCITAKTDQPGNRHMYSLLTVFTYKFVVFRAILLTIIWTGDINLLTNLLVYLSFKNLHSIDTQFEDEEDHSIK